MPVTKLKLYKKQQPDDEVKPDNSGLNVPFKIHNQNFRLALPTNDDRSEESDQDDTEDLLSPELLKGRRRRSSASSKYCLYRHVDSYSRFFQTESKSTDLNRLRLLTSQYLRPNAKFVGHQHSGCARYDIKVEFKSVDLVSSVVTGFFYISGLTDEHPLITTCFKGEIINNPMTQISRGSNGAKNTYRGGSGAETKKYSFITEEKNWSSFPKNDLDHWKKITGSPYTYTETDLRRKLQQIQSGNVNLLHIYMRWKEEFLLPDSRIKLLTGASFEGFYYIVLNLGSATEPHVLENGKVPELSPGTMNGLYFYTQSEKFQSLTLQYVEERGVAPSYTFA